MTYYIAIFTLITRLRLSIPPELELLTSYRLIRILILDFRSI
jgi:hypothetical protein